MKKTFALIISSILIFSCLFGCSNSSSSDDTKHIEVQNEETAEIIATEDVTESVKEPVLINWEASLNTPEVADDIKAAFREIGEKPEYIVSIEHVKDRETALFVRRDYKVTFDKGDLIDLFDEDDRKWNNAIEWRITTEEWNEGEPEREQYPREYLVTIKFWTDDDSTNILQWSHTGNGQLQEGN